MDLIPIVLCGGLSRRMIPLGEDFAPKIFHPLLGGDETLLQKTVRRAQSVATDLPTLIVTAEAHLALAQQHARSFPSIHYIAEPVSRNTAAAITMAAFYVQERWGDRMLCVMPSDHAVENDAAWAQTVQNACKQRKSVLFGAPATTPDTELGYISHTSQGEAPYPVSAFHEKPSLPQALQLIAQGAMWNVGMFLMRTEIMLAAMHVHAPDILQQCRAAFSARSLQGGAVIFDPDVYASIPCEPIDKALMEKMHGLHVMPLTTGWSDLGTWQRVYAALVKDTHGNAFLGETCAVENIQHSVIYTLPAHQIIWNAHSQEISVTARR